MRFLVREILNKSYLINGQTVLRDNGKSLEEAGHSTKDASFILFQMIQNSLQYEKIYIIKQTQ